MCSKVRMCKSREEISTIKAGQPTHECLLAEMRDSGCLRAMVETEALLVLCTASTGLHDDDACAVARLPTAL